MHPLSDGIRRLTTAGGVALAVLALAGPARAAPGDHIYYMNQRTFAIPITPEPSSTGIQQVMLYVSTDDGRTYRLQSTVGPSEKAFRFTATADGWYWFAVQTQDTAGRLYPPNLNAVPPGLKVCIDTLPPAIYLKQVASNEAAAAFEWDIREENPDLFTLRADYRPVGGRDWIPLQIPPRLAGQFPWNPAMRGPWEVRLQMRDKAGNPGESTTTVTAGAWRPDAGNQVVPVTPRGNVKMLNSLQVQLNYKLDRVGKSKVSKVQIYVTENDGRTWQPYSKEAPREGGPFTVQMTHEGVFGFCVVAVSGVGLSEPPLPGTPPEVTVEIDVTRPVVTLATPVVGTGADVNKVTIRYQASDKNLGATPIRIFWSADLNGNWTEIASNLPNEGFYVWTVPEEVPAQFHLKVEAIDLAGNIGREVTRQLVNVDPIKPKAIITGVEAVPPPVTPDR